MDKVYVVLDAAAAAAGWRPCAASVIAADHLNSGVRHDSLVLTPALRRRPVAAGGGWKVKGGGRKAEGDEGEDEGVCNEARVSTQY